MEFPPPFFDHFETFWSLDPRRECRLSDEKISDFDLKMGIFSFFEWNVRKIGVQNQKMPQFCLGTKDDFERNSKFQFTSVWYNISKGVRQ